MEIIGKITEINGPIITATGLDGIGMLDLAEVGPFRLVGEVVRLAGNAAIIQVYEDVTGLKPGDQVVSARRPLSVLLGPGLLSNIYDGVQRPLVALAEKSGSFIQKGVKAPPLDTARKWSFRPLAAEGDEVGPGSVIGEVPETDAIMHRVLVPPGVTGRIVTLAPAGDYAIEEPLYTVASSEARHACRLAEYWPVRKPRPFKTRHKSRLPLITGQRIIDTFFPICKGGTATIPGGFGTGKTMTQHALAKWCDADVIVYIGCGERGNEMTDVLNEFPRLVDPRTDRPLMQRTVMIANTSNMPVAAREVSIYTGVTIAEYYRDMGYQVALMADSTSRWAEALRELASRLGDMPAEEGYPPYLATRLAEFYERAGFVETLGNREASISIIGAVSPPGGDFSEPVTQHTTRFVKCFWALDKILADARHYPSISWIESYTEYLDDLADWWRDIDPDFLDLRQEAMHILLEEARLQQIVKLIGPDALPPEDRFVLHCAETIKNGFLQQNAFDSNDMYCAPEKQARLLSVLMAFYRNGRRLLGQGVPLDELLGLKRVGELGRLKSDVPNDQLEAIDQAGKELLAEMEALTKRVKAKGRT